MKLCKYCNEEIPVTDEYWYFRKVDGGQVPHIHKACALKRQQQRRGIMAPRTSEDELAIELKKKLAKTNKLNDYSTDELMMIIGQIQEEYPNIMFDKSVIYGR
jgi:SH3-like domain-containing protein